MSSEPKRRVEADEFVLRDETGVMRAALKMTPDGPGLFLYDLSGKIRAGLLSGKDAPGLALFDSEGTPRVSLDLAAGEPALVLRDVDGTAQISMVLEESGPRLNLSDANSGPRIRLGAQRGDSSLVFADLNGKPRIALGMSGGVPGLTLLDAVGRRRAKLIVAEETSTFDLYNSDGKTCSSGTVVWVEPRLHAAEVDAKLAREGSARKQLEETLQAREKRYSALVAASGELVWTTSAGGEIVEDVPSWRSVTGQSEEEIKGAGWIEALHPEDRERVAGTGNRPWKRAVPTETECRVRGRAGDYGAFGLRAVPVLAGDEAVAEWVVTATDISPRKRLEEALRASEERLGEGGGYAGPITSGATGQRRAREISGGRRRPVAGIVAGERSRPRR